MPSPLRSALTIAGSDSSGGAGIQADLKAFAALDVYGTSAITAITAQNTLGMVAVEALVADLVTAQIEAIAGDITLHATTSERFESTHLKQCLCTAHCLPVRRHRTRHRVIGTAGQTRCLALQLQQAAAIGISKAVLTSKLPGAAELTCSFENPAVLGQRRNTRPAHPPHGHRRPRRRPSPRRPPLPRGAGHRRRPPPDGDRLARRR